MKQYKFTSVESISTQDILQKSGRWILLAFLATTSCVHLYNTRFLTSHNYFYTHKIKFEILESVDSYYDLEQNNYMLGRETSF